MRPPLHNDNRRGDPLPNLAARLAGGDELAADTICRRLDGPVRRAAAGLFAPETPDIDDVAQETLVAVLDYIHRNQGFTGDLIRFAVTVARNRCRNIVIQRMRRPELPIETMAEWIAHPQHSPLELLEDRETLGLLQRG